MLQNSQNWHTAGTQAERDYLHQQNLELNRILSQYAGGVESGYDPATGRWTTENADLGYGDIDPYDRANAKRLYGVTDAELDAYLRNTDRYVNYAHQHPLSYLGRKMCIRDSIDTLNFVMTVNVSSGKTLSAVKNLYTEEEITAISGQENQYPVK